MTLRVFYVRPARATGYGAGDGGSYDDAWNGFEAVDWSALSRSAPAALLKVCVPQGFVPILVNWSFDLAQESPVPSREPAQSV